MEQITYLLLFKFEEELEEEGVYVLKVFQRHDEWSSKRRKDTQERILKNISVYEIYSKYQLKKSMYNTITSLFLQKSLEAYRNSGIHPN